METNAIAESSSESERLAIDLFEQYRLEKANIDWVLSKAAATSLRSWGLPESVVLAAWITPLIQHHLLSEQELITRFGNKPVELAQRLLEYRSSAANALNNKNRAFEMPGQGYSHLLRALLRDIYCDYPDFQKILLIVAYHDALLDLNGSLELGRFTLAVHLPLIEILCLWEIREKWQKKCGELIFAHSDEERSTYQNIAKLAQKTQWNTVEEASQILWKKIRLERRGPTERAEKIWLIENRKRAEKLISFCYLRKVLMQKAKLNRLEVNRDWFQIRLHETGSLYFRMSQTDVGYSDRKTNSPEDILNQLWVTIQCPTEDACYRMLGLLHSISKPIDPRFSQRFDDFIAAPQPNGYRALQTALNFHPADFIPNADPNLTILVEVRIMTSDMQKINRWGIIEAFYRKTFPYREDEKYRNVWWSQDQEKELLVKVNTQLKSGTSYQKFSDFIRDHELNTRSPVLYVFTPKGQVVLMDNGCTALDFAYQIHSELGNHAARISVNKQPVNHGYFLSNGDMIHIHYEPHFSGPDFSWLGQVSTRRALKIIRHQLTAPAHPHHPGRIAIQKALANALNFYQNKKSFHLNITTGQLDAFLTRYARARKFLDLNDFYARIRTNAQKGKILPSRLVQLLISEILAPSLVYEDGQPLSYPPIRINLCDSCRPVPGEPILGIEHQSGPIRRITVHHTECRLGGESRKEIKLRWNIQAGDDERELAEYLILAWDRPQLLADILACVYNTPNSYLHNVDAKVQSDGVAEISLIASNPDRLALTKILAQIEDKVNGLIRSWTNPVSPYHPLIIQKHKPGRTDIGNPFFEHIVYLPNDFFDRERELAEINAWLNEPKSLPWMILHGQRRVGKTSLLMYLTHTVYYLSSQVKPIFIDIRGRPGSTIGDIARFILSEISRSLEKEMPPSPPDEDPVNWFQEGIEAITASINVPKLLVMLDEFDTVVEDPILQAEPLIQQNLAFIIQHCPNVRWLLSVRESIYHSELPVQLASLIQKPVGVFIDSLEGEHAKRFIFELLISGNIHTPGGPYDARGKPSTAANPLVEKILSLSGGHPFYVRQLFFYLPREVVGSHSTHYLSEEDIETAIREVLRNGNNLFDHYIRNINTIQRSALNAIAEASENQDWVPAKLIYQKLGLPKKGVSQDDINRALSALARLSIIQKQDKDSNTRVRIPVKLFARWLREQLPSR